MRKTYIEFIRIIACILVIIPHIDTWDIPLFYCLCIFGVPIFCMIAGYVLFMSNKKYSSLLIRTWKKILIPILIVVLFVIIFQDFIYNKDTIYGCIIHFDIKKIMESIPYILKLDFGKISTALNHLWYIYHYILFILLFPLLHYLYHKKESNLYFIIIILVFSLFSIINDIYYLNHLSPIFYQKYYSPKLLIYFLLGIFFYKNESFLIQHKKGIIFLSIILLVIGSFFKYCNLTYISNEYSTDVTSFGCILSSIGAFLILLNIGLLFNSNKPINYIADKTFLIYIIHYPIIEIFKPTIFEILGHYPGAVIPRLLCAVIVFFLFLLPISIFDFIIKYLKKRIGFKSERNN